jgi:guanine deaminase
LNDWLIDFSFQSVVDSGTAIAHCPLSNFFFAHAVLPARRAMDMGVKASDTSIIHTRAINIYS